ncbi:MAG TPA: hypothetical protein VGI10_13305 [Polyangiaceae bacterium]
MSAGRYFLLVVGLLCGCGKEIAQTAERAPPSTAPDCSAPGALVLPSSAVFGTGNEPRSILVGSGYGGGEGPGLFVTARDAFRVYLNGALVITSSAPRVAEFVPLTLLPGDNVLTVVIAASSGTPAALLELDELEQSYTSDASWRVSSAPSSGFDSPSYDDSNWPNAVDFGRIGELPGCDPGSGFPTDSQARWIGPAPGSGSTAVLRKVISIVPIGYGAGTTGGNGATPTVVSTWDELQAAATTADTPAVILLAEGKYDFRDAERDQPACPSACASDSSKMEYAVLVPPATCALALVTKTRNERTLNLGSNKTLVGLGRGAQIRGVSMEFGSSHNLIARNLAVYDVNPALIEAGDAFGLSQPNQVWIDHCTTKWISDGFSDARAGAQNMTLSWVHFDGVTPDECDGEHTRAAQITDAIATFHHCFFDHVESHSPTAINATARVHLFNNLLADNLDYGVGSGCGAQVLMEGNTLQRVAIATERATCADGSLLGLIQAPAGSNYYGADVGPNHGGDGMEPHDAVFKPTYPYIVDVPQDTWLTVLSRAGAGGPWAVPLVLD